MGFEEPDKKYRDEPEFNLENPEDDFIPEKNWDDNDLLVATGYDGDVNFDVYWEMYGWHCFCFQWAKAFELVNIWSLVPLFQAGSFHISLVSPAGTATTQAHHAYRLWLLLRSSHPYLQEQSAKGFAMPKIC